MKLTRVKHISFFPQKDMFETIDVPLHRDFDKSVADFTQFVPTAESVRSLPAGDIGLQHYDFPDGKDDGRAVPLGRKRGIDIAELSESVVSQNTSVNESVETIKSDMADLKAISDNAGSSSPE